MPEEVDEMLGRLLSHEDAGTRCDAAGVVSFVQQIHSGKARIAKEVFAMRDSFGRVLSHCSELLHSLNWLGGGGARVAEAVQGLSG